MQQHPVIVLPGTEYADLCALVTFMYNGEVNIYQEQLPAILAMADTLHIRGLADIAGVMFASKLSLRINHCLKNILLLLALVLVIYFSSTSKSLKYSYTKVKMINLCTAVTAAIKQGPCGISNCI